MFCSGFVFLPVDTWILHTADLPHVQRVVYSTICYLDRQATGGILIEI